MQFIIAYFIFGIPFFLTSFFCGLMFIFIIQKIEDIKDFKLYSRKNCLLFLLNFLISLFIGVSWILVLFFVVFRICQRKED